MQISWCHGKARAVGMEKAIDLEMARTTSTCTSSKEKTIDTKLKMRMWMLVIYPLGSIVWADS